MTLTTADRLELQQLLMKYTHILDYGSVDALGEIWTEDCEFRVDTPAYHVRGLTDLKEMLRTTTRDFPHVRHVVSNCYVDTIGDEAVMQSYLQILDLQDFRVTVFARYIDKCVKLPQGWRIRERACLNG